MPVSDAILTQILSQLENLTVQQQTLQAKVQCVLDASFTDPNMSTARCVDLDA